MTSDERIKSDFVDDLFEAILLLEDIEECYRFFEDVCTVGEIKSIAQRFAVARKLDGGEIYSDIVRETGASTATISRVKRCLNYGADGYKLLIERLKRSRR